MKTCGKCGETKDYAEFHKNKRKADGCQSYCKPCMKVRNRDYYLATPERNPQRQESNLRARKVAREYVDDYLSRNPCVDCGYSNIRALQFDHVRGTKVLAISMMVCRGTVPTTIQEEIDKCEVRCANCHSLVTHERRQ